MNKHIIRHVSIWPWFVWCNQCLGGKTQSVSSPFLIFNVNRAIAKIEQNGRKKKKHGERYFGSFEIIVIASQRCAQTEEAPTFAQTDQGKSNICMVRVINVTVPGLDRVQWFCHLTLKRAGSQMSCTQLPTPLQRKNRKEHKGVEISDLFVCFFFFCIRGDGEDNQSLNTCAGIVIKTSN
jgi:hypothetical protein